MTIKSLIAALLLTLSAAALAADTNGQFRHHELFSSSPAYQHSWQALVQEARRAATSVIKLNASATPVHRLDYEADMHLVYPLCAAQQCFSQRLSM
jgi:glycerol uptake facilitator-like aquaporin